MGKIGKFERDLIEFLQDFGGGDAGFIARNLYDKNGLKYGYDYAKKKISAIFKSGEIKSLMRSKTGQGPFYYYLSKDKKPESFTFTDDEIYLCKYY